MSMKQKIHNCFVTFDQPLHQKAFEIAKSCNDEDIDMIHVQEVSTMSYLRCTGYIMTRSGLKDVLEVCYVKASIEKNVRRVCLITGHFNYTKSAYLYIQEMVKFVQNAKK